MCRHFQQEQDQQVKTFALGTGPTCVDICSRNRTSTCRHFQQEQDQHVKTFSVTTRPTHVDICSRSRTNMCRHLQQEQDQNLKKICCKKRTKSCIGTVDTFSINKTSTCRHLQQEQDYYMKTFAVGNKKVKGTICLLTKKTIQQKCSRSFSAD